MKPNDICDYIFNHYLNNNKTRSAIMINGDWGTGKSYFIENTLIPFLQDETRNYRCVVISLYGVENISDLHQKLFSETIISCNKIKKKAAKPIHEGTMFLFDTIIKSGLKHYNIELSDPSHFIDSISENINMNNCLFIFEDLERSKIDIVELMGYINNLVEHRNMKVLLVANENNITKDDSAKNEYLAVKEKTVSDTIKFENNLETVIENVLDDFKIDFQGIEKSKNVKNIERIMYNSHSYNFRTYIFACQKYTDIVDCIGETKIDEEYLINTFYSLIYFSFKFRENNDIEWEADIDFSASLGENNYPLPKVVYNYIKNHRLDKNDIIKSQCAFIDNKKYDKRQWSNDEDIEIVDNYWMHTEKDIKKSLNVIINKLDDVNEISFYLYGRILVAALMIKYKLEIDVEIEKLVRKMKHNLEGQSGKIKQDVMFNFGVDPDDKDLYGKYKAIKTELIESISKSEDVLLGFEYNPNNAHDIYDFISHNSNEYSYKGRFTTNINVGNFVKMFLECNPEQMRYLFYTFNIIYPYTSISCPSETEYKILCDLKNTLLKEHDKYKLDKVQEYNYKSFLDVLENVIKRYF